MNWSNVKLIFVREVRDQLRDRRTLFTIAVLPLLLYPLLGMSFLQVSQFMHEQPTRIWVVGAQDLPHDPPLLEETSFHSDLLSVDESRLMLLDVDNPAPGRDDAGQIRGVCAGADSERQVRGSGAISGRV